MAGLKELKQRRKSIQSTLKVTSAMKMIAASKLRRSQDNMIKARPYSSKIKKVMQMLVYGAGSFRSEYFSERPGNRTLYVVITSDKGLCGGFNNSIIKAFNSLFKPGSGDKVIAVGNRIAANLDRRGIHSSKEYRNSFTNLNFSLAASIGADIISLYRSREIDRVMVIYNRFESALSQVVMREQILPVEFEPMEEGPSGLPSMKNMATEPSAGDLFDIIFPRYVNFLVWRGVLESFASENAARMTTMDSATENAKEMVHKFTLEINKARQAAITQEISEIVGGSSALNG